MFTLLLLAISTEPDIHRCHLSVGDITSCDVTGFNGDAPVETSPDRIRICSIAVGSVASCGPSYTGMTVLLREGRYHACSVLSGFVTGCQATGFTGETVIDVTP